MKSFVSVLALGLAMSMGVAHAADGDGKTKQQNKMATCNADAGDKKGDERKAFMKECLSAKKATQQEKMKSCNVDAKGMKGDERAKMQAKLEQLEETAPAPLPSLFSIRNDMSKAVPVHVLARGDYQNKGVNSLVFYDIIPHMKRAGAVWAESNPELATNAKVQSQWEDFEHVNHKRRRAFTKQLVTSH